MRKTAYLLYACLFCFSSFAQITDDLTFGIQLGTGKTMVSVDDPSDLPSGAVKISDGKTSKVENISGRAIRLMVNYNFNEYLAFSTGLHFNNKRLFIRNDDGSYIGGSVYTANYVQLPVLLRYSSNEIADKLNLIISVGPLFDFKMSEGNEGADYAHFMNLANNRHDYGPREHNGDNAPTALFSGTGLSVLIATGVEYHFNDSFNAYVGISYQTSFTNMLNRNLKYNDAEKTSIAETMSWKASLLLIDLGLGFSL